LPELPEVEVIRRHIEPFVVRRTIARVVTTAPSYFFLTPPAKLRRLLPGRTFVSLERRGKYLLAGLDDGSTLLLHLGMTGQLFASGTTSVRLLRRAQRAVTTLRRFEPDEHTHLQFLFSDAGPTLLFRDMRKFGKCALIGAGEPTDRLKRLGIDALAIRGSDLYRATRSRKIGIKALLLDQSVLAGVGNIYADEALFRAGLRPTRRAAALDENECKSLAYAVRKVLQQAIARGGSSISDYIRPDGRDGGYQDERRVYAREGEPCASCGTGIRRIVIGQRSSHFCPCCQR
jgi:formamidopyrimidine-DNA glycosylase